jgi:hypothetical protein
MWTVVENTRHDGPMTPRLIALSLLLSGCAGSAPDRAQMTLDALRAALEPVRRAADASCDAVAALRSDAGDTRAGVVATESCEGTKAVLADVAALEHGARVLLEQGRPDEARALVVRGFELLRGLAR